MGSAEDRAMHVLPPRAGRLFVQTTSNSAATFDLRTLGPQTRTTDSAMQYGDPGAQRKFIRVAAMGADCYIALGATSGAVGSITATTTGTNAANSSAPIPQGTYQDFDLEDADLFIGYVTASGTGYIYVYINSPQ